ncbi:hypothetical protein [Sedimentibacter sp.]|nr:hypothetical protein [Sedimentibacter sp.]
MISVIDNGRVSAQGTHNVLLETSLLYKNMWVAHSYAKDSMDTNAQEVLV